MVWVAPLSAGTHGMGAPVSAEIHGMSGTCKCGPHGMEGTYKRRNPWQIYKRFNIV